MNKFLFTIFIVSLLVLPSLSLAAMNHMDHNKGYENCPFVTIGMTHCAMMQESLYYAISHLEAFARSFTAVPVLALILAGMLFMTFFRPPAESFFTEYLYLEHAAAMTPVRTFLHWFSLHENSPSFSGRR